MDQPIDLADVFPADPALKSQTLLGEPCATGVLHAFSATASRMRSA